MTYLLNFLMPLVLISFVLLTAGSLKLSLDVTDLKKKVTEIEDVVNAQDARIKILENR